MANCYKPVDLRKRSHERRERAQARGHKFYTGTPCSKCGVMTRYTSTGNCAACAKRAAAEHYAASLVGGSSTIDSMRNPLCSAAYFRA